MKKYQESVASGEHLFDHLYLTIFQFGTEWIVIINSEIPKRITTVSKDDSCLDVVIPSFNKSWVAKLMSNNEAHNLFKPLAEDHTDLTIFSLLTALRLR